MNTTMRNAILAASLAALGMSAAAQKSGAKKHTAATTRATASQQQHAAHLKTGQLTSRQSAHLKTKKTALHQPIPSSRKQHQKLSSDTALPTPSKDSDQIHLREHNARMF